MDLNLRGKTVKVLEENTGEILRDMRVSDDFVVVTSKAQGKKKTKIDKLDFIKIKIYCASKGHDPERERQHTE